MRIDSISQLGYSQNVASVGRLTKTQQVSQNKNQQAEVAPPDNGLTGAERAFFAKLFPGSVLQISTHKTYSLSGLNATVELGQIVNRKG